MGGDDYFEIEFWILSEAFADRYLELGFWI
jgi:hypothetical protein